LSVVGCRRFYDRLVFVIEVRYNPPKALSANHKPKINNLRHSVYFLAHFIFDTPAKQDYTSDIIIQELHHGEAKREKRRRGIWGVLDFRI